MPILNEWECFVILIKILKGFAVLKWKFEERIERGTRDFYHLSNEKLGPFSLPFTGASRSCHVRKKTKERDNYNVIWTMATKPSDVIGGKGMPPHIALAQALTKVILFPFDMHFLLARVTTCYPCPSWHDSLHS